MITSFVATLALAGGSLFLVGGGSTPDEIPKKFIAACGGPESLIIVMGQTREEPKNAISSKELLEENGAKNVRLFDQDKPADKAKLLEELKNAKGIWIPGGDQTLFIERWGGAWLREHFPSLLKQGTHFFGTSAGAMIMSHPMIAGPGKEPNTAETMEGIGLVDFLIDTHYRERNRQGRLRHAMGQTKHQKAIGLDAGEWIVVKDGKIIETHGKPDLIGFK